MARLNEPPALAPALSTTAAQLGAESVDAVKRRFTRQNRDLAKNNSTQSLRIRSLEIEVGKLQAENLAFQERVLQLQNELDEARSGQLSGEAVRRVREELQAKLAELSGLVEGIDALAKAAGDGVVETVRERKPLEGQWRERQPLTEAMRENQMPTIAEDKHYPRTTLGVDEIQSLRLSDQGSNESPDLGPPPVAHFDYEDPVKQLSPSAIGPSTETPEEDEGLPASLSINLETRRRRKDSQPKLEIRRHSIIAQSPKKTDNEPLTILRTGAKRKLADRELDKPVPSLAKSDFTFSRKGAASDSKALVAPSTPEDSSALGERAAEIIPTASATPPRPSRRVLGDKSVNMSPRKVLAPPATEKAGKDPPEPLPRPAGPRSVSASAHNRRVSSIPQPLPHEEALPTVELAPFNNDLHQQVLAPETLAQPEDIFSPTPSETPAARPTDEHIRAGTPPPSDLSTLSIATDGGNGGGVRPSRRARVAVNYAEPSLTTKIRRPGKGMVDAVNGLVDPRRAMSAPVDKQSVPRSVTVKRELFENDEAGELGLDWRRLPSAMEDVVVAGSPLAPKSVEISSSDPLTSQADAPVYRPEHPSAASATISTLMAAGRRHRRESTQHLQHPSGGLDSDVAAKLHELDLYDFKDSSSPPSSSAEKFTALSTKTLGDNAKSSKVPAGSHRRHSSVPKILRETPGGMQALEGRTGDGPVHSASANGTAGVVGGPAGSDGRAERAASRRRSMIS
ncbi:hypothetical protein B0A54_01302 [Friedmanniomyces endolithicus]|uniref:Shugoshin C-terminal domain-containing protein n=1 Tax=Friedmanniomyces endolithicus TaxID=329885 RepID=A0A4U0VL83_9PEZI|nr:hypothetical protein B0A54_01302 [Friedmanniomyces endolithicus]